MISYFDTIIGRTYTPSGDTFGGADWSYILCGLLLIIVSYWFFKFLFSLFR